MRELSTRHYLGALPAVILCGILLMLGAPLWASSLVVTSPLQTYRELVSEMRESSVRPQAARTLLRVKIEEGRRAPGLSVIGTAEGHEVDTAQRVGRYLQARFGWTFVLFSALGRSGIPAFDGLIVDADHQAVANVSLKRFALGELAPMKRKIANGFSRMEAFSSGEAWARHVVAHTEWKSGVDRNGVVPEQFGFTGGKSLALFEKVRAEMNYAALIYAVETGRPRWLIVDVQDDSMLTELDRLMLGNLTEPGDGRMALVFAGTQVLTLEAGTVGADPVLTPRGGVAPVSQAGCMEDLKR